MIKNILVFLFTSIVLFRAHAYDPCDLKKSINTLAESKCQRIETVISPKNSEKFLISAALLTKSIKTHKKKTTLILIPGGPGSDSQSIKASFNSKDLINAFWAHLDLNVVLYDPRGTGASQFSKDAQFYSYEDFETGLQVSDLGKVVDSFSPNDPVVLLAHSAGGNTAAKFAAQYPEKVKGLILYSASLSNREIGLSNLRLFGKNFEYFNRHLAACGPQTANLKVEHERIESFLRNALKLVRIQKKRPQNLAERFYPKTFRAELISASENDLTCVSRIPETLKRWSRKIEALPSEVKTLVQKQSELVFDVSTHVAPTIRRGTWIKTALICSEGLTPKEYKSTLWLDGLNFSQDTCYGFPPVFEEPPTLAWTQKIKAKTLLIAGRDDPYQILSMVLRNANLIRNSEVTIFEAGGHESHLSHPYEFYKLLESFLQSLDRQTEIAES